MSWSNITDRKEKSLTEYLDVLIDKLYFFLNKYVTASRISKGMQLLKCFDPNEYERHEWHGAFSQTPKF